MNAHTEQAMLRRYRAGYRLSAIARECGVTYHDVVAVLHASGIKADRVNARNNLGDDPVKRVSQNRWVRRRQALNRAG